MSLLAHELDCILLEQVPWLRHFSHHSPIYSPPATCLFRPAGCSQHPSWAELGWRVLSWLPLLVWLLNAVGSSPWCLTCWSRLACQRGTAERSWHLHRTPNEEVLKTVCRTGWCWGPNSGSMLSIWANHPMQQHATSRCLASWHHMGQLRDLWGTWSNYNFHETRQNEVRWMCLHTSTFSWSSFWGTADYSRSFPRTHHFHTWVRDHTRSPSPSDCSQKRQIAGASAPFSNARAWRLRSCWWSQFDLRHQRLKRCGSTAVSVFDFPWIWCTHREISHHCWESLTQLSSQGLFQLFWIRTHLSNFSNFAPHP